MSSKFLFALGLFVLIGSNASLFGSGWVEHFTKTKPPVTGIFLLDLLIAFFPEVYQTPSARIIMDLIAGFALSGSTVVVYEGSRRRGNKIQFNQLLLGAYWWILQFVAIGFATPVFLGLYLTKPVKDTDYVQVGNMRSYVVLVAILGTSVLNQMLETSIFKKQLDITVIVLWLLFPVVTISLGVILDRSKSATPTQPRFVQLIPYLLAFATGAVGHFRTVKVIMDGEFRLSDITSNAPCVFLIFDLVGVALSCYVWLKGDRRVSPFSYFWVAVLFGPAAHFALLAAIRDRAVDDRIPALDKKNRD